MTTIDIPGGVVKWFEPFVVTNQKKSVGLPTACTTPITSYQPCRAAKRLQIISDRLSILNCRIKYQLVITWLCMLIKCSNNGQLGMHVHSTCHNFV